MIVDELYRYNSANKQFENVTLFFILSFLFSCFFLIFNLKNSNYKDINFEDAGEGDMPK